MQADNSLKEQILCIAKEAKQASVQLARTSTTAKDTALSKMTERLASRKGKILEANQKDVQNARKKGLSTAMIDRLTLNEKRIQGMVDSIRQIVTLEDPVGEIMRMWKRPNGLVIGKKRVPIGVIGIIYESRPNVTSEAASLCLKSGNAVILRGGSESFNSNQSIVHILTKSLKECGLPPGAIQLVPTTEREAVDYLLKLNEYVDLIIPRGGEALIRKVTESSSIPVIKHYKGVCHIYVDESADLDMSLKICFNAKVQRPGVCNAMETLLVNEKVASHFLPLMAKKFSSAGVELRGCEETCKIIKGTKRAKEDDWYAEYLDLILAVKVVPDIDAAVRHITKYGSQHSDAIVTKDYSNAQKFLDEVDSSAVYVNASTRFTDGGEFGMGAEMGISTDKLHARGPMGLEELTSYKYIIYGNGQIRE